MASTSKIPNYHDDPTSESETSNAVLGEEAQLFQDFFKMINEISNQKTYQRVNDFVTEFATLKDEIERKTTETDQLKAQLMAEQASLEQKIEDLETKHTNVKIEVVKTCAAAVAEEETKREKLQAQLSLTEAALEDQRRLAADMGMNVQELNQRNETLASQRKDETQKLVKAETKIRLLEGKVRVLEEGSDKQRENLKHQGSTISQLKSSLKDTENARAAVSQNLDTTTRKLREIEGFSLSLFKDDTAADSARLDNLWQACIRVVTDCFVEDLEESVLKDAKAWVPLTNSHQHTHATLVPRSNSREAKQMRTAVVLATLSAHLTRHIFTASYLPKGESDFPYLLLDMAAKDPAKEQFCRGLLLSTIDDEIKRLSNTKVAILTEEIVTLVRGLVGPKRAGHFAKELNMVIVSAADAWRTFETRTSHFEAALDGNILDWEWRTLKFNSAGVQLAQEKVKQSDFLTDDIVLVLFPRVYTIDGASDIPVFPGVVLQKSQTTTASREVVEVNASRESQEKAMGRRKLSSPRVGQQGFPVPGSFLGS